MPQSSPCLASNAVERRIIKQSAGGELGGLALGDCLIAQRRKRCQRLVAERMCRTFAFELDRIYPTQQHAEIGCRRRARREQIGDLVEPHRIVCAPRRVGGDLRVGRSFAEASVERLGRCLACDRKRDRT